MSNLSRFARFLKIAPEVQTALDQGKPVVALESTIISHGMPYPDNLTMARSVEQIIRDNGAVPATIAILHGQIHIGLEEEQLQLLATSQEVSKVSRRDMAYIVSEKKHGATTVAATMLCANLAGIKVFATGGIGGVHRGAEDSMDISADLTELSKTPVAVVCAGVKSILDIGRTLEYLETEGVPVVGYQSDDFPAFYTRQSGYGVDYRLDQPAQVAGVMHTQWSLDLPGGFVIANPVPAESAMAEQVISDAITQALGEADAQGISGKDVTPFLLGRIKELTGGSSLKTNIALVEHNAKVAAEIACAYHA